MEDLIVRLEAVVLRIAGKPFLMPSPTDRRRRTVIEWRKVARPTRHHPIT
jgi:hypothetical protein